MKTRFSLITVSALVLGLILAMSSCKKDEEITSDQTEMLQDNALSEQSWEDANAATDEGMAKMDGINTSMDANSRLGTCATVTIDTSVSPKTMLIDFGPTNCLCRDGKYRRGQIMVTFTSRLRISGAIVTVSPSNYYVNDHKVEGLRTITNNGVNTAGNVSFNITVVNGKITKPSGVSMTWNTNHTREWTSGYNTPNRFDDVFSVTGVRSGVNFKGVSYTATVLTPLIVKMNCPWIVQGSVNFVNSNLKNAVLDFGSGSCDNQATITVNNRTKTITLR